ncbi:RNase adapter RapZ [Microbacterium sp. CFBP 8790]|uniref:RNase adapter RapZ n=1 Tax=unclassified Microbacterium TaxID=2609290 RepID=UPI0006FB2623|nr:MULTISPECIES: RNase adapter RapZ [unclassified Microbacterium]AOX44747.1 RNase adaptor protein RapZ [Microbacterium sp. BH-3-3-3]KQR84977.1 glmZ(sRNA)-inactivating NTPase [Microbacterium sp. Leaf179]MBD8207244.1 RNase adapter RapZ [Microbacterium sp. CFBP 8801]MBD8217914.1 RNase adapter RapZ [Microbacterium sp. CFBP 13617]MBD8510966.1 RNase adapter RapZ [Microbacterium sp. CFBP 8790]
MEPARDEPGEVLIVTGMSGAGRSTVANALEDLDWYVVDNLPPQMLRPLLELTELAGGAVPRVAVVVDVRGRSLFSDLPEAMRSLQAGRQVRVVFLNASDAVLVRRFEAVRRPHPLQGEGTILDGIRRERERLAPVREAADVVIDTSSLNVHQLSLRTVALFGDEGAARHTVTLMSFGFKYGLPPDVDLVADMRFLPNPFWNEDLRALTGEDPRVREYVLGQEGAAEFLGAYAAALNPVLEGYQRENKRHSVVAIGCTGGKHRSVVMARELAARLSDVPGVAVRVAHRDLGRE